MVNITSIFIVLGFTYLSLGFIYMKNYQNINPVFKAIAFYALTLVSFWSVIIDAFSLLGSNFRNFANLGANILFYFASLHVLVTSYNYYKNRSSLNLNGNNVVNGIDLSEISNQFVLWTLGLYFISSGIKYIVGGV